MALRNSKITSEIIHNCNRLLSHKADISLKGRAPVTLNSETENSQRQPAHRYKIANTEKPQSLPQIQFESNDDTLFSELQPSAKSQFQFEFHSPKWAEKVNENNPFPESIKSVRHSTLTYSDRQKADDKMLQSKLISFSPLSRNFSTVGVRTYSRGPSENNSEGKCSKTINKCALPSKRNCKISNKDCPRFKLDSCTQSKGSNCDLNYLDPHCTKQMAPYPSYSESCAEQLPDDPSECQQCPWRTCDAADSIEPGKPVRHKRSYSTCGCSRHLEASAGVVTGSPLTPAVGDVQGFIFDARKPPCKQPPGPCEVRRQNEEKKRQQKIPRVNPNTHKKKAADEPSEEIAAAEIVGQQMQKLAVNPYTLEPLSRVATKMQNDSSWIDQGVADGPEVVASEKKHPNCHRKKKPKRPKETVIDVDESKPEMLANKRKKPHGDEGHPPPCKEDHGQSKNCPKEPMKKPKYKKRPMTESFYKRPDEPYSDDGFRR